MNSQCRCERTQHEKLKPLYKLMHLSCPCIRRGCRIPSRFTCDGTNRRPAFQWSGAPRGTKSFALIVDDPDAVPVTGHIFTHFAMIDIPKDVDHLCVKNSGNGLTRGNGITRGDRICDPGIPLKNGFGTFGWGGPCPPATNGPHHYRFIVYALNTKHLNVAADTLLFAELFEACFNKNIIGKGSFSASYKRKQARQ